MLNLIYNAVIDCSVAKQHYKILGEKIITSVILPQVTEGLAEHETAITCAL